MIRDTVNGRCNNHDRSSGCRNEVTRTVYDGDQVLYDIRALADTVGETSENDNAVGAYVGAVGYTHAGGIDAPLGLFKGADTVWPLTDWRGQYDLGVCGATLCSAHYYFPGGPATAYGEQAVLPDGPPSWYGELFLRAADGSGLQYRRHRYYAPGSGQFSRRNIRSADACRYGV